MLLILVSCVEPVVAQDELGALRCGVRFVDNDRTLDRAAVATVEAIADLTGIEVEIVPVRAADIPIAIEQGTIDFAATSDVRHDDVVASDPYVFYDVAIFHHADVPIEGVDDLVGKRVFVGRALRGIVADRPGIDVVKNLTALRALLDVDREMLDAAILDAQRGATLVIDAAFGHVVMTQIEGAKRGDRFVVGSDDAETLAFLNDAIARLAASGELDRLHATLAAVPTMPAPRPWSERHPVAVTAIAALLVLLIAAGMCIAVLLRVLNGRRVAEERFTDVFRAGPTGMVISDLGDGRLHAANDAFVEMFGYTLDEVLGKTADELGVWMDMGKRTALQQQVLEHGSVDGFETVLRSRAGGAMFCRLSAKVIEYAGADRLLCSIEDIGEYKTAVSEAERSASMLRSTIESTADGILVVDDRGKMSVWNERFREMWGIPREIIASGDDDRAIGFVLDQLEDPEAFAAKVRELYDNVEAESFDVLRFKDGRVFERYSTPHRLGDRCVGRVWSFRDATERHRTEQRQQRMVNELDHRVKNMLATVQAISEETAAGASSPADFAERFRGRIQSLARVHEALAHGQWTGVQLGELVDHLTAPYRGTSGKRVEVNGEGVVLPVASVLPISMALHELATNAVKYGALSVPEGAIDVQWKQPDSDQALLLRWIERGGPRVSEPTHRGFGLRFIEQGIEYELGGRVAIRFRECGFECEMSIPLQVRDG